MSKPGPWPIDPKLYDKGWHFNETVLLLQYDIPDPHICRCTICSHKCSHTSPYFHTFSLLHMFMLYLIPHMHYFLPFAPVFISLILIKCAKIMSYSCVTGTGLNAGPKSLPCPRNRKVIVYLPCILNTYRALYYNTSAMP